MEIVLLILILMALIILPRWLVSRLTGYDPLPYIGNLFFSRYGGYESFWYAQPAPSDGQHNMVHSSKHMLLDDLASSDDIEAVEHFEDDSEAQHEPVPMQLLLENLSH